MSQDDDNIVYVVIHRGDSIDAYNDLDDPDSLAAQLACARGKATIDEVEVTESGTAYTYHMTVEDGNLKSQTGYFMRFADRQQLQLHSQDILSLDTLKSYPLPEPALESLPARLKADLEETGQLKIRAGYSYDAQQFFGVEKGWHIDDVEEDMWGRFAELVELIGSEQAAFDWLFVKEGPDKYTKETIADIRGVSDRAVGENLRKAEQHLNP
jgi:hypothetical protein